MDIREADLRESDHARGWHLGAISLATAGLFVSLYSLRHHRLVLANGKSDAFCNVSAVVNCDAMELSEYSRFLTLPWGLWGTAYFIAILFLLLFSIRRMGNRQEHLLAYSFWVSSGLLVSATLGFVAFKFIGALCLICLSIYAISLGQGLMLWWGIKKRFITLKPFRFKKLYTGLVTSILGFASVFVAYNIIGEQELQKPTKVVAHPAGEEAPKTLADIQNIPVALNQYSGLGEDYRKGPDDAKVSIIIFSDFQCPGCKGVSDILEEVYQSHPGQTRIIYRNFPLDQSCNSLLQHRMHEYACTAATMARCAGRYGKFWSYHDIAFAKQGELNDVSSKQWVKELGLTDEQVQACQADKGIAEKIRDDISLGIKLGIDGTPTVYLNGRRFVGRWSELKDEVKRFVEQQ